MNCRKDTELYRAGGARKVVVGTRKCDHEGGDR
jgi:hypothetical protein